MFRLHVPGRPGASQPATTGEAGPNGGDSPVPARPARLDQGQPGWPSSREERRLGMPDETRHESADLEDYEVLDASDTLDAPPGSDPLARGVAPPERWTAGIRYGTTESEQERGERADQWR